MSYSLKQARFWIAGLALALVALIGVACAPADTPSPQPSPAPNATAPSVAPATAAPGSTAHENLPVGVDAEGNFYRGDPNAPVKLIEYSDFQ